MGGPPAEKGHPVPRAILQRHALVIGQLGIGVQVAVPELQLDLGHRPVHAVTSSPLNWYRSAFWNCTEPCGRSMKFRALVWKSVSPT
jgi:hypothetical protein